MPRPVEALPCGSRSMISTCSPIAASAVPRLIAVVVLPTPPFWLAIASTRGGVGLWIRVDSGITCGDATGGSAVSVMGIVSEARGLESSVILGRRPESRQFLDHDDT